MVIRGYCTSSRREDAGLGSRGWAGDGGERKKSSEDRQSSINPSAMQLINFEFVIAFLKA